MIWFIVFSLCEFGLIISLLYTCKSMRINRDSARARSILLSAQVSDTDKALSRLASELSFEKSKVAFLAETLNELTIEMTPADAGAINDPRPRRRTSGEPRNQDQSKQES